MEKLSRLRRELEGISPSAPRAATMATVVADWLDHLPARIKDPTSVQIVRSHGERITRELGKIPVRKLQARDVERLLGKMAADGLSTSTIQVRSALTVLRRQQREDRLRLGPHTRTSMTWCSATTPGGRCHASG